MYFNVMPFCLGQFLPGQEVQFHVHTGQGNTTIDTHQKYRKVSELGITLDYIVSKLFST